MSVVVAAVLAALSSPAPPAPASIEHARIEVRSGMSPAAALAEAAQTKGESWVGWSVAALPKAAEICCFDHRFKNAGCSLAETKDSWGTHDDDVRPGRAELYVLVRTTAGAPSRVRMVSPSCPVHGADRRLVWLGPVDAGASLAVLDDLLDARDEKVAENAMAAIAFHADPRADAPLARRALDRAASEHAREQAMFWAAQVRGRAGYKLVEGILGSDASGEIRQHAVFALTQSQLPEAPQRIKRVAVEDRDPEVRSQALFWLAQTNVEGAGEWIVSRLDAEQDEEVREQAVFALTQLRDGTDWLLDVLHSKRDPEIIRKALFWLGQSKDPRALAEIEKILDR